MQETKKDFQPLSKTAREFEPFQNITQQVETGPGNGLTFENLDGNVVVYGDMEIKPTDSVEEVQKVIDSFIRIRDQMILMQKNNTSRPKQR